MENTHAILRGSADCLDLLARDQAAEQVDIKNIRGGECRVESTLCVGMDRVRSSARERYDYRRNRDPKYHPVSLGAYFWCSTAPAYANGRGRTRNNRGTCTGNEGLGSISTCRKLKKIAVLPANTVNGNERHCRRQACDANHDQ